MASDSEPDEDYEVDPTTITPPTAKRMCTRSMNVPPTELKELNSATPQEESSVSDDGAEGDQEEGDDEEDETLVEKPKKEVATAELEPEATKSEKTESKTGTTQTNDVVST
ncbi:MAG TPA: hypothetical protein VN457_08465 [Chlamydiales bacterium]|nr:hypothetical protein [Chlamydiales bacterium]